MDTIKAVQRPGEAYHIKPEYLSEWGAESTEETIITEGELRRLSVEWGISIDELVDQLEGIE